MLNLVPIIIFVFLLATFLHVEFLFRIFLLLVVVTVLARVWNYLVPRSLAASRRYESRVFFGESTEVETTITNRGRLPIPWLHVRDRLPPAVATPPIVEEAVGIAAGDHATIAATLTCRQRGYFPIGPLTAQTGDVLGIGRVQLELLPVCYLTVYPRIVPLEVIDLPSRTPFGSVRTRLPLYQDPARVGGVREYRPGDSLRDVHWRTSAAVGSLQVKTHDPAMTIQTIIALNLSVAEFDRQTAYHATELGIITAASIATHLIGARQEVGLLTHGRDSHDRDPLPYLPPRKGQDQLMRLLETLARAETLDGGESFAAHVRGHVARLGWGSTVVLIVGREDDELVKTAVFMRQLGFTIVIVLIGISSRYRPELARLSALGFANYTIWRDEDFHVWRRPEAATAAR